MKSGVRLLIALSKEKVKMKLTNMKTGEEYVPHEGTTLYTSSEKLSQRMMLEYTRSGWIVSIGYDDIGEQYGITFVRNQNE